MTTTDEEQQAHEQMARLARRALAMLDPHDRPDDATLWLAWRGILLNAEPDITTTTTVTGMNCDAGHYAPHTITRETSNGHTVNWLAVCNRCGETQTPRHNHNDEETDDARLVRGDPRRA